MMFKIRPMRATWGAALAVLGLFTAQAAYADLPTLTTSGNHIQQNGQNYMLGGIGISGDAGLAPGQGFSDTTAYDPTNYSNALGYFERCVDLVTNRSPHYGRAYGWGTRMVRFGLTPDWWDPNRNGTSFDWYKLSGYVDNVVAPLCAYCQRKGVYIVLDTGYVTDSTTYMLQMNWPQYNQDPSKGAIWRVWDYIASPGYDNGHNLHSALRGSNVAFEIYNEPINIEGYSSASDQGAWNDYKARIQYVTDHVRYDLGVQNVMLIGTPFYSSQPQWVTSNPVTGSNIGYVAHLYPGTTYQHGNTPGEVYNNLQNSGNIGGNSGSLGGLAATYPVVVTEFNWFQNGNGNGPYQGTTSIFGSGLRSWINDHAAGYSAWTYGEMLNNRFDTNANGLDSNSEDYGQSAYEMLWVTFFYSGGQVPGNFASGAVYRLTPAVNTNACLDVYGYGTASPTPVYEWAWGGGTNQKWLFENQNNGRYRLTPQFNRGAALDVMNGYTADNTDVREFAWNGSPAQQWWATSLGDGTYRLSPGTNSDGCLDVYGGATGNKSRIDQYSWNGSIAQRWYISQQ